MRNHHFQQNISDITIHAERFGDAIDSCNTNKMITILDNLPQNQRRQILDHNQTAIGFGLMLGSFMEDGYSAASYHTAIILKDMCVSYDSFNVFSQNWNLISDKMKAVLISFGQQSITQNSPFANPESLTKSNIYSSIRHNINNYFSFSQDQSYYSYYLTLNLIANVRDADFRLDDTFFNRMTEFFPGNNSLIESFKRDQNLSMVLRNSVMRILNPQYQSVASTSLSNQPATSTSPTNQVLSQLQELNLGDHRSGP